MEDFLINSSQVLFGELNDYETIQESVFIAIFKNLKAYLNQTIHDHVWDVKDYILIASMVVLVIAMVFIKVKGNTTSDSNSPRSPTTPPPVNIKCSNDCLCCDMFRKKRKSNREPRSRPNNVLKEIEMDTESSMKGEEKPPKIPISYSEPKRKSKLEMPQTPGRRTPKRVFYFDEYENNTKDLDTLRKIKAYTAREAREAHAEWEVREEAATSAALAVSQAVTAARKQIKPVDEDSKSTD